MLEIYQFIVPTTSLTLPISWFVTLEYIVRQSLNMT